MSATASQRRRAGTSRALSLLATMVLAALAAPAAAHAEGPYWKLEAHSVPTYLNLEPGKEAQMRVTAINLGDGAAKPPITLSDTLPKGLVATGVSIREGDTTERSEEGCTELSKFPEPPATLSCTWTKTKNTEGGGLPPRVEVPAYGRLELLVTVKAKEGSEAPKSGEVNQATVQGANTRSESASEPITVSAAEVPFGVEKYEVRPENEDGSLETQAGSHPFQLTTVLNFDQTLKPAAFGPEVPAAPELAKNLTFDLPAGLVADASAVAQCSTTQFTEDVEAGQGNLNGCEGDTAIGVAMVTYFGIPVPGFQTKEVPVFNLVPNPGEPARFGFEVSSVPVFLDTSVRTGENYGAVVSVRDASTSVEVLSSDVTIWGVPGSRSHLQSRGWECIDAGFFEGAERGEIIKPCPEAESSPKAFLTLPTACSSEESMRETTVAGEDWPTSPGHNGVAHEERKLEGAADKFLMPTLTGCEQLRFGLEEMIVQPDAQSTSTPSGLNVKVKVPQTGILAPTGLAEADVKETTVALPEGLQANAGAANGLGACAAAREQDLLENAGFNGFAVGLEEAAQLDNEHFEPGPVTCPESSKVGKVKIVTPLLPDPLDGFVYLARQDTNPFSSPLVLYLIAQDPVSGVRVKLAGEVKINESTGQFISVFRNTPAQPFSELDLEFFDGQRASQTTPASCGTYHASASFVPWSGGATVQDSPEFTLDSGPGGSSCPSGSLPFAPSFEAGTTINQADAFTPFTLTIGRPDGQQALKSITMQLPPGLAAMIASVKECPEPPNEQEWASCGPESEIGQSTAVSGLGGDPVTLGGKVYFAGPYKGAPFSIVDVTPVNVGPFHLPDVIVRSTINVNPTTAAATITSDPLPQFVKGLPSQIKELNVTVDREHFQFNPTNCESMKVTGTLAGYEGASEEVSSPFQVANCAALPFAPDFTASTKAHTSKADGANLFVKITYPKGDYANVAKSVTELPYALPSRLTTIQKACPDTTFEANPASCDEGSIIGEGIVHTPVFKNPLIGPAYLVSHANRAFPDVDIVLQGEGITLVLDGHTDIKNSITKTTFETVPDAPVEVFELNLPEGPHSALGANDNLCKPEKPGIVSEKVTEHVKGRTIQVTKKVHKMVPEELVIPTKLTAQNGRVLEQKTKIAVSGCGGVKASKVAKKPAKKPKKSKKKKK